MGFGKMKNAFYVNARYNEFFLMIIITFLQNLMRNFDQLNCKENLKPRNLAFGIFFFIFQSINEIKDFTLKAH